MSDKTREMLTQQVQNTIDNIGRLFDALDRPFDDEWDNLDREQVTDTIYELPLEVIDERGRPFAVVLTVGGPHIEAVAEGYATPKFVGYWGGETVTLHSPYADRLIDWFIER